MRALLLFVFSCSYILPATWRAFRADPEDAAPAITKALDAKNLNVESFDQAGRKITTGWQDVSEGVDRVRQRYVITWEGEEGGVTIYVRHEAQDQEIDEGRPTWGSTYHDGSKETSMLDQITKELKSMSKPMT